ncbi:MAG: stress response translation initiation inhibitor YciH [Kiritimatiellales bacterium]
MPIDLSSLNLTPEWSKNTPGGQLPPKTCHAKGVKENPQQKPSAPKGDGIVRVGRETKGRKGAGVTVITGIPSHPEGLEKLAKQFKQQCGTGGTVKNGTIEIQGDHRDILVDELQKLGYTVKRVGG